MHPAKIVVIGAGSANFGLNTLATLMASEALRGSDLALVDRDAQTLDVVARLAQRLSRAWQAGIRVTKHTGHCEALSGADFVVLAIEVPPREELWRSDFEIPLRHGVRQPYAENGGPGGFAHAARNIGPVMEIARDMERLCPRAWLVNFTNPMMRICDAIDRYSRIRVVGLCHQISAGYAMVGKVLAKDLDLEAPAAFTDCHASPQTNEPRNIMAARTMGKVSIQAAGLNHFTWMINLRRRDTGEDLYPLFARRWAAFDPGFEPLTRRVYDAFGLFPIPGDEHLSEYLPWVSDPATRPWEKYELSLYDWQYWSNHRPRARQGLARLADGLDDLAPLRELESEGAVEVIEALAGAGERYHQALNLRNDGPIANLPAGAIVETPAVVTGASVRAVAIGSLPDPIAELCRREITVSRLCVDAAVNGDRQAALQCLLLDPVVRDMDTARAILDDYLTAYREYLPQFWR